MWEIRVHVVEDVGDLEQSAELTSRLQDELLELDVDAVTHPSATPIDGAKGDPVSWGELVVSLSTGLPAFVGAIRTWRERQRGATVTIEYAGDKLTLTNATSEQQSALVNDWLARHDEA